MTALGRLLAAMAFSVTVVCAATIGGQSAKAHVVSGDGSANWYFFGATYNEERTEAVDPVNVIFYRGGSWTLGGLENHMHADITPTDPGSDYGMFAETGSDQRMIWRDLRGNTTSDVQDLQMASAGPTVERWHFRGWDDLEHSRFAGNHPRYQWVVGGIHRDNEDHSGPARDWDEARVWVVEAMGEHCSYRKWRKHPGARGDFQGYSNTGWVARISRRHVDNPNGCTGA